MGKYFGFFSEDIEQDQEKTLDDLVGFDEVVDEDINTTKEFRIKETVGIPKKEAVKITNIKKKVVKKK
jgi:hypothetical protein